MRVFCGLMLLATWVQAQSPKGQEVYAKYCVQCHGETGAGDGYAADYVNPKPRNFTTGAFKFRSTQSGQLPLDSDLERVVRDGIPGTSMPAFAQIGESSIKEVVAYIQPFYQHIIERDSEEGFYPPKVAEMGTPPKVNQGMVDHGREVYLESGCGDCHGYEGRADGPSSLTLKDDYDDVILPANLMRGWEFRSGHSLSDIFKAFTTGLSGTPMASFADAIPAEDRWALAAYVQSLSPGEEPPASSQVSAALIDEVPADMDDPAWQQADVAYFPLTGQMMWDPVNTDPAIRSVSVRAFHDGARVAILCEWDDPSFSVAGAQAAATGDDDDEWDFGDEEEESEDEDFWGDEDEGGGAAGEVMADQFAIQLPAGQPADNERPYFVMGDSKNPVNLWRWTQDGSLAAVAGEAGSGHQNLWTEYSGEILLSNQAAKGRDNISDVADGLAISGQVHYRNGQYRMLVTRDLSGGAATDVQLQPGKFVPVSFWAWDGHRGEHDANGSLSAWYYLRLEQAVDKMVYVKTAVAVILTLVFLYWAMVAARNKAGDRDVRETPVDADMPA